MMHRNPILDLSRSTAVDRVLGGASVPLSSKRWANLGAEIFAEPAFLELAKGLSGDERKRAFRKWLREKDAELRSTETVLVDKQKELHRLEEVKKRYENAVAWAANGIALEKADTSRFREFRKSVARGHAYHAPFPDGTSPTLDYENEYLRYAEAFVVQHDWGAAFARADIGTAPFRLPYEICAFEFQVSGRRVIALATEIDEQIAFNAALWTPIGWLLPGFLYWSGGLWSANGRHLDVGETLDKVVQMVGSQLQAICIALDAEIATTHVERARHERSHPPNAQALLKPYHVVSLARRERAPALEGPAGTGRKKRLHFRRGHWRHFETFKTWVKWTLVGDPDLGFVDKEYRL